METRATRTGRSPETRVRHARTAILRPGAPRAGIGGIPRSRAHGLASLRRARGRVHRGRPTFLSHRHVERFDDHVRDELAAGQEWLGILDRAPEAYLGDDAALGGDADVAQNRSLHRQYFLDHRLEVDV